MEETFHSAAERAENSCYCAGPNCPPSGIFDLGVGCKVGLAFLRPIKNLTCAIFNRSDFRDFFYTIKPFWVGDFGAKI